MSIVPKKGYIFLFLGDIIVFVASLWISLGLRTLSIPVWEAFIQHIIPFSLLFIAWSFIFFLAGLYGKHTRILRAKLPQTIFYTQTLNMMVAAVFFFMIPYFGIAPKTILAIYLIVSSALIFAWRVYIFPYIRPSYRAKVVLIASGSDVDKLVEEVGSDGHYPFIFDTILDTNNVDAHQVVQHVCRIAEEGDDAFIAADMSDKSMSAVLPILYDTAFRKRRFALIDVNQLYQDVFDSVPLSLTHYSWVLSNVSVSWAHDVVKKGIDVVLALILGVLSLILYPIVAWAIKLDDGGPIFITQERIGKFQNKIKIVKFRSMSGNDKGNYKNGKTELKITRVGKIIRRLRIDELPQLWNVVKGDLSFVGPRPELPALVNHYSSKIPYYDARHLITPGLTGWAQIKHERHPHHGTDVEETKNKLSYDLFYLKNRSFLLDLYIMFQTARVVLTEKGS
jgi:exopolysaccharide biosynthesis polyprenyl glycosylphosphotransferase